jgi:hypothetical protein
MPLPSTYEPAAVNLAFPDRDKPSFTRGSATLADHRGSPRVSPAGGQFLVRHHRSAGCFVVQTGYAAHAQAAADTRPAEVDRRDPARAGRRRTDFLAIADWNMLRGPIGRFASARLDRTVELRGDLDVHPFSWSPRAEINDLYIADTDWSGKPHMARIERVEVSVRLLPLLRREVILPRLALIKAGPEPDPERQGAEQLDARQAGPEQAEGQAAGHPAADRRHRRMRYDDRQRDMALNVTMSTREAKGEQARFRMRGDGSSQRRAVQAGGDRRTAAELRPEKPYPFDADIRAGSTSLTARGSTDRGFDLNTINSRFTLEGPT